MKTALRRLVTRVTGSAAVNDAPFPRGPRAGVAGRTTYRAEFAEFLAERRGAGMSEALEVIRRAEERFNGGWSGPEYRRFTELALETFRPLYDEGTDAELIRTYQVHAPADFMRMLSYDIPTEADLRPIVDALATRSSVQIVDYGCGLAQRTIAVARHLASRGVEASLTFVDISRELHQDFLQFVSVKYQIPHRFVAVTADDFYPTLPEHDYCDNVSVLEHVRDPLRVIENTHRALRPGGLFLAAVADEAEEMMHVSADLEPVRKRLAVLDYLPVGQCCGASLFRKPIRSGRQ